MVCIDDPRVSLTLSPLFDMEGECWRLHDNRIWNINTIVRALDELHNDESNHNCGIELHWGECLNGHVSILVDKKSGCQCNLE